MGHGMNYFDDKKKRAMRRRNHIARDLRSPDGKYRQRRLDNKSKSDKYPLVFDED